LNESEQASLMAEYQITNGTKESIESKQRKAKKAEIAWKINRQGAGVKWQRKR